MTSPEHQLEARLVEKLLDLKYVHRTEIRDRATLKSKFQALNHVKFINGVPVTQIELKTPGIVNYKNDPGNAYSKA